MITNEVIQADPLLWEATYAIRKGDAFIVLVSLTAPSTLRACSGIVAALRLLRVACVFGRSFSAAELGTPRRLGKA